MLNGFFALLFFCIHYSSALLYCSLDVVIATMRSKTTKSSNFATTMDVQKKTMKIAKLEALTYMEQLWI